MKNRMPYKNLTLLTTAVLLVGFTSMLPMASAHTCSANEGCDASHCPMGEDHDHTDINADTANDHCSSKAKSPDGSCYYPSDPVHLPPKVCEALGYPPGGCPGTKFRMMTPNLEAQVPNLPGKGSC